jgi:hypothetical protein
MIKEKEETLEWVEKYKSEWSENPDTIREEIDELWSIRDKREKMKERRDA